CASPGGGCSGIFCYINGLESW
nr:immunoglobulin heavy chain junction region [Macaca mulatta]MOW46518.1 immunoglobulin heavy chain junction region [Macaca mulatta]MOW46543.1 immunoglobulin heavy chain junction region [Macaca mulatta]MOW47945.1 immunoglobulin heavy chain junction region [Macaca mulatta]MOW49405.1 immunoglobulin heavy chain junction region [Macaca mulatta]